MKKWITFVLLLGLCLSMCACGGSEKKAVLGEWKAVFGEGSLALNKDGTGTLMVDGKTSNITWKYDKELACYVIATSTYSLNANLKTEGDLTYLNVRGTEFFRAEDCEAGLKIVLDKFRTKVAEYAEGKEKLQMNTPYTVGECTVEFTGVTTSEDGKAVLLNATVKNNATSGKSISNILPSGFSKLIYFYGGSTNGGGGFNWEYGTSGWLEPGETKTAVLTLQHFDDGLLEKTLEHFGAVIGVVCLDPMDGKEYYIDLSEYVKK